MATNAASHLEAHVIEIEEGSFQMRMVLGCEMYRRPDRFKIDYYVLVSKNIYFLV